MDPWREAVADVYTRRASDVGGMTLIETIINTR